MKKRVLLFLSLMLPAMSFAENGVVLVPGQNQYEFATNTNDDVFQIFRTQNFTGQANFLVHTAMMNVCVDRDLPDVDCHETAHGGMICHHSPGMCLKWETRPDAKKDRFIEITFDGLPMSGDVETYDLQFTKRISGIFRDHVTRAFDIKVNQTLTPRTISKVQGNPDTNETWKFLIK